MGLLADWAEQAAEALSFLPGEIIVVLLAFSPIGEVRISVPAGVFLFQMGWAEAFVWSLLGNLAVAPIAAWLYPRIETMVRRTERGTRWLDRLYEKTRARSSARVEKLQESAVAVFIAIPLPGSGAWTGVLIAHIFGLQWRHAWRYYYAGVVAATVLVTILVETGRIAF